MRPPPLSVEASARFRQTAPEDEEEECGTEPETISGPETRRLSLLAVSQRGCSTASFSSVNLTLEHEVQFQTGDAHTGRTELLTTVRRFQNQFS